MMTLVRRQLIEANPSASSGEDGLRFTHVLIQEAAYEGVPKEVCADLHERLARRLGSNPASEDEIVGFHLERSYRCRAELGPVGDPERQLAAQATARLEAAGRKAFVLGDPEACSNLLGRAASLLPPDDPTRLTLLPTLGAALLEAGHLAEADRILTEAIERSADDELLQARALVEQQFVRLQRHRRSRRRATGGGCRLERLRRARGRHWPDSGVVTESIQRLDRRPGRKGGRGMATRCGARATHR